MDNLEKYIKHNRSAFDTEAPRADVWKAIETEIAAANSVESFIRTNRAAFDTETPSLKVWSTIEKQVNPQPMNKVVRLTWLRQAAAAVALLVVGVLIGFYLNENKVDNALVQASSQVAPELQEVEDFYNQKVQSKYAQLVSFNPDPSVMADLKQIDEVQEELKRELKNAPTSTREDIVRRLIENYQIKLGILERVLNHIKEQPLDNQKSQQQHESI